MALTAVYISAIIGYARFCVEKPAGDGQRRPVNPGDFDRGEQVKEREVPALARKR